MDIADARPVVPRMLVAPEDPVRIAAPGIAAPGAAPIAPLVLVGPDAEVRFLSAPPFDCLAIAIPLPQWDA